MYLSSRSRGNESTAQQPTAGQSSSSKKFVTCMYQVDRKFVASLTTKIPFLRKSSATVGSPATKYNKLFMSKVISSDAKLYLLRNPSS